MMLDDAGRLGGADGGANNAEPEAGALPLGQSSPPMSLQVRLVDTEAGLAGLSSDWVGLQDRAGSPGFFQSQAWCAHVLDAVGTSSGAILKPVVVTGWLGERMVALWPLALRRAGGVRLLTGMGAPYDQYAEVLVDRGFDRDAAVSALIAALASARLADGVLLRKVRMTGAAHRLTSLGARSVDVGERAPQVHLDPQRPFEEFLAGISAKTRKNLRNYQNRLARFGRLEHRVLEGADVGATIVAAFEGRRAWLSTHGLSSEAFRDPHFETVMRALAGSRRHGLGLVGFVLMLDERPIAVQWGFIQSRRYYAFMSSRDPAFEDYSAGRLHLRHVLEACHRLGVTQVDLMVPAVPYKMTWTDTADPLVDIVMAWSVRGRLSLDLYQGRLRPLLKRFGARLPAAVRRPLSELVNARPA
jgi:CelD/BcsL family acetyltransferase involved in cellulose biosynthesis